MKKIMLVGLLALVLVGGCCENQGVFQQVSQSMNTINAAAAPFYGPAAEGSPEAQMAIAAALVAAPLAQALQDQWCANLSDPGVKQLEDLAKSVTAMNKAAKARGMFK